VRLLIKLAAASSFSYDNSYYHKMQGFIYNIIRDTRYGVLHNKKTYKYFCFSNIFPIGDFHQGDKRNLLISSPDRVFLKIIEEKLLSFSESKTPIKIGEMIFYVEDVTPLEIKIKDNLNLITATPIIVRIPESKYEEYKIPIRFRKKRYAYWRPEHQVYPFIKQLEDNLVKKYKQFYKKDINIDGLLEDLKFIKSVSNKVVIDGIERIFIGSIWKFSFGFLNSKKKKLLKFGLDCGFGERNSLGFGFVNQVFNDE